MIGKDFPAKYLYYLSCVKLETTEIHQFHSWLRKSCE